MLWTGQDIQAWLLLSGMCNLLSVTDSAPSHPAWLLLHWDGNQLPRFLYEVLESKGLKTVTNLSPAAQVQQEMLLLFHTRERKCLAGQVDGTLNELLCGYSSQTLGNNSSLPHVMGHSPDPVPGGRSPCIGRGVMGLSPKEQRHTRRNCATLGQRCARCLTSPNTRLENPFCQ